MTLRRNATGSSAGRTAALRATTPRARVACKHRTDTPFAWPAIMTSAIVVAATRDARAMLGRVKVQSAAAGVNVLILLYARCCSALEASERFWCVWRDQSRGRRCEVSPCEAASWRALCGHGLPTEVGNNAAEVIHNSNQSTHSRANSSHSCRRLRRCHCSLTSTSATFTTTCCEPRCSVTGTWSPMLNCSTIASTSSELCTRSPPTATMRSPGVGSPAALTVNPLHVGRDSASEPRTCGEIRQAGHRCGESAPDARLRCSTIRLHGMHDHARR